LPILSRASGKSHSVEVDAWHGGDRGNFMPLLLPGMKYNTSADNYRPVRQMQLIRFNGEGWELFDDLVSE
jgi:hypothetical protein